MESDRQGDDPEGNEPPTPPPVRSSTEILAAIDLFQGLDPIQVQLLATIGREEQIKRNATVFEEGDAGDKFYVVLEGAIRISRMVAGMGEEALAVVRPGSYFGEMSLIDDAPRSATAIAHETSKLFVVGRRDFEDLLFADRGLAYDVLWNFVRTLCRRLRATNDKMTFLATTSKF